MSGIAFVSDGNNNSGEAMPRSLSTCPQQVLLVVLPCELAVVRPSTVLPLRL